VSFKCTYDYGVAPIPGTCGPFSMSFDTARGVHLIRTRNINAPYPGTPLPIDLFNELNSLKSDNAEEDTFSPEPGVRPCDHDFVSRDRYRCTIAEIGSEVTP